MWMNENGWAFGLRTRVRCVNLAPMVWIFWHARQAEHLNTTPCFITRKVRDGLSSNLWYGIEAMSWRWFSGQWEKQQRHFRQITLGNREGEYVCIICTLKRISRYSVCPERQHVLLTAFFFFLVRSSVTNVFTRTKDALSEHTLHTVIVLCDSRELRSKLLSCTSFVGVHHTPVHKLELRLTLHRRTVRCDAGFCRLYSVTGRWR